MALLSIFATAILPIVAIAAAGFLLGRFKDVDPEPLNVATVYVLAPALVLHSLATASFGGATLARLAVGAVAFLLVMAAVAEGIGRLLGEAEPTLSAFVLVSTFPNSGNYGIPLSEFAFGATGRSTAVVFLAVQAVLMYTLGTYVAARSEGAGGLSGVKRVLGVPLVYAVVLALVARWLGAVPPADAAAMRTLALVGNASIPVLLLVLGIQLSNTDYGAVTRTVGVANALKMGVAPVVGVGIALLLGFPDPTVARTFVLECATPAAVTPLLLVIEFGGEDAAEYVGAVILTTTLASVPVLTVLITVLQAGVLL